MLGLGNSLVRSINNSLVSGIEFINYPQLGDVGEAGIISYVDHKEGDSVATVWEIVPMSISIPDGNNEFYSDTVANAYNYIYQTFEYIKNGVVYNDFTLASKNFIDGFVSHWRNNQDAFDEGFYYFPSSISRTLSDFALSGGGSIDDNTVSGYSSSFVLNTDNAFDVDSGYTYYSISETDPAKKYHFLAARSYELQLQYKEAVNIDPVVFSSRTVEDLENDRHEYLRGELDFTSNSSTGFIPDGLHGMGGQTLCVIQARNCQLFFNITIDLGVLAPPELISKLNETEQPWWNSSEQLYLKFKAGNAGHSDISFPFLTQLDQGSTNKIVGEFAIPLRKAKTSDINSTFSNYNRVFYDGLVVKSENGNAFYKICYVGELDIRQFSSRSFIAKVVGNELAPLNSSEMANYFPDITVDEIQSALTDQSIKDFHFDKGTNTPIPRDRWWTVIRVRDLSIFTNARPESEKIAFPTEMQSVIVPMFPQYNLAGASITYGTDIDGGLQEGGGTIPFTFEEFMKSSLNTGYTEDTDYVNK